MLSWEMLLYCSGQTLAMIQQPHAAQHPVLPFTYLHCLRASACDADCQWWMMNDEVRYKVNVNEVLHRCEAYMLFYVRIQPRQAHPSVPKSKVEPQSSRKRSTSPAAVDTAGISSDVDPDSVPLSKRFKLARPHQQQQTSQQHQPQHAQQADLKQHAAALLAGYETMDSSAPPKPPELAAPKQQAELPASAGGLHSHSNGLLHGTEDDTDRAKLNHHTHTASASGLALLPESHKAMPANSHSNGHAPHASIASGVTPGFHTSGGNLQSTPLASRSVSKLSGLDEPSLLQKKLYASLASADDAVVPTASHWSSDSSQRWHGAVSCTTSTDAAAEAPSGNAWVLAQKAAVSTSAATAAGQVPSRFDSTLDAKVVNVGTPEKLPGSSAQVAFGFAQKQVPHPRLKSIFQPSGPSKPDADHTQTLSNSHSCSNQPSLTSSVQMQHDNGQIARQDFPMQFGKPSRAAKHAQHTAPLHLPKPATVQTNSAEQTTPDQQSSGMGLPSLGMPEQAQASSQQTQAPGASQQQAGRWQAELSASAVSKRASSQSNTSQKRRGGLFKSMQTCISG